MNQSELIEKVATTTSMTRVAVGEVVEATVAAVVESLKGGEEVRLQGLGIFDVSERPARQGRNPQTGEAIQIAATRAVRFRAGKSAKDALNGPPAKKAAAKKPAKPAAAKAAPAKKAAK